MIIYPYNSLTDDLLKSISHEQARILLMTTLNCMNNNKAAEDQVYFFHNIETNPDFEEEEKQKHIAALRPKGKEVLMTLFMGLRYQSKNVIQLREIFVMEPNAYERIRRQKIYPQDCMPVIYEHLIKSLLMSLIQAGAVYQIVNHEAMEKKEDIMEELYKPAIILPFNKDNTIN